MQTILVEKINVYGCTYLFYSYNNIASVAYVMVWIMVLKDDAGINLINVKT